MAARRRSTASRSKASSGRSRSSAGRGRSSAATSRRSESSGPKIGADGRAQIACPRCNTKYQVPEEHLDSVVSCKNCKTAFTPRRAAQGARVNRRAAKSGGAGPALLRAAIIASPFLLFIIIYQLTKGPDKPRTIERVKTMRILGSEHAPYQKAHAFCKGIADKQDIAIERVVAWADVWARAKNKKPGSYKVVNNEDKQAFINETIQGIYSSKFGTVFKTHDVDTIEHEAVEFPDDAKEITVTLSFPFKEDRNIGMAVVRHEVKDGPNGWQVHDWELVSFYEDRKREGKYRKKHKTLKTPEYKEITIKGKKVKSNQGEIVPMDHLEDTPPELRKRIDDLIAKLFTESDSPKASIMAAKDLEEIGKPAIPRILHAMYERPCKTQFERECFGMLVKTYNNMVGTGVPWFFSDDVSSVFGSSDEDRKKLIQALFGNWWFHYHKADKNFQGETDEELDKAMEAGAESIDTGRRKVDKGPVKPKK